MYGDVAVKPWEPERSLPNMRCDQNEAAERAFSGKTFCISFLTLKEAADQVSPLTYRRLPHPEEG